MTGLTVLQCIGIIFLCIIGFAVLIFLLVLFAPVNYSVKAAGQDKDVAAKAGITFVFGIVRAAAFYEKGDIWYKISVLGIKIKSGIFGDKNSDKDRKRKIKRKKLRFSRKRTDAVSEPLEPAAPSPAVSRETVIKMLEEQREKEKKKKNFFNFPKLKDGKKKKTAKPKKSFKEKFNELWCKVQKFVNKAKEFKDKASSIKRALNTKTGQRAIKFVKYQLLKIFRIIKPDSIKGYMKYGTGDPCTTAEIYGIAAQASFLITKDQLIVEPDFNNKVIDIDVTIKGKIFLYAILAIAIQTLMNKDVSRIWKEIRRITNG